MPTLQISNEQAVSFKGSIWAQADQPMTLSVWQVHWPKHWLKFEEYADSPQELAKIELSEHWRKLNFSAQLTKEHHVYFTVDKPGVLWLDQADLSEVQDPIPHSARMTDPNRKDWIPLLAQAPMSRLRPTDPQLEKPAPGAPSSLQPLGEKDPLSGLLRVR